MSELSNVSRQLERELGQHELAVDRLDKQTRTAEEKKYASSTKYGQAVLKTYTIPIAERMRDRLKALSRGRGAVDGATVHKHLKDSQPELLAVLALKASLDALGTHEKPTFVQLTTHIGSVIETELRLSWYQQENREMYKNITKRFHKATGTRQKVTVYKLRFNDAGIVWENWPQSTKHKVGAWAYEAINAVTGWMQVNTYTTKKRRQNNVDFTQQFLGMRDAIMHRASEMAYCLWPMVCEPVEWEPSGGGGFLTEDIRKNTPLVRGDFDVSTVQEGVPLDFINNLQRQHYKVNADVLEVMEWCFENRRTVGKFSCDDLLPTDAFYPHGEPTEDDERFKDWKYEQRCRRDHNAQLGQKNWDSTEMLFVARKFKAEEYWCLPWSFCYRGRVYPLSIGLTIQGTDPNKSLFYFAEEGPVNEEWLSWHCATTFGHDKKSHAFRKAWAKENVSLISSVATDPLGTIQDWAQADEPWCFLAACFEYHACCIEATKQTSGLPIGVDATCSGLQHLSLLTLDYNAAREVNVVSSGHDEPSDGYRTVAEVARTHLDEDIHPFITRSETKRTVMTTPYGVSRDSARKYIKKALKEVGFDLSIPGRLGKIVDAIYCKGVPTVFAGPVAVMNWLQSQVEGLLEKSEVIEWTSPSGFKVRQDIRHPNNIRISTQVMGKTSARLNCTVADGYLDPNKQSHIGAISPNLVHACDAALLHLVFAYWDKPFSVIHDCCLGRSCDMDEMAYEIRLHTAEMYKGLPLKDWADQLGLEIPEGLMKNTLNPDDVLDSPYYFC
jgi:DNA-directed RNA polymerase